MDLFDYMRENTQKQEAPLASRLRPRTLDEIVGQKHILGKDKLLYRAIRADKLSSLIFYGPPGTGKTTIARVIANTTRADFTQLNATVAGKKDMEAVVNRAKDNLGMYGRKTILFVDEIHRFNKGQQDYLLPFVEDGTVILIGATTENPYFEVNGALLSRSVIFELKPLEKADILELIHRALTDTERGMGSYGADITEDAAEFLADIAGGDARSALNAVELGVLTTEQSEDGRIHLTQEVMAECIQKDHVEVLAGLALVEVLAHAVDRHKAVGVGLLHLAVERLRRLAVVLAALRVAQDHVLAAQGGDHRGGYFARVGTLGLGGAVLRAQLHVRTLQGLGHLREVGERGAYDEVDARAYLAAACHDVLCEFHALGGKGVHLPVAGYDFLSHCPIRFFELLDVRSCSAAWATPRRRTTA